MELTQRGHRGITVPRGEIRFRLNFSGVASITSMNPPRQPVTKLQYAPAEPRPHPWLKALVIIAGAVGVFPLAFGCMCLFYALGGMEGSREALWLGVAFVVGG